MNLGRIASYALRTAPIALLIGLGSGGEAWAKTAPPPPPPPPVEAEMAPPPPPVAPPEAGAMPMRPPPPPPEVEDRARFRGGVALEGGAIIVPSLFTVEVVGVQGQMGGQINNLIGVYAVPSFDVVFGDYGGVNLSFAAMVDFTIIPEITVGIGPDIGAFAAFGGSATTAGASVSAAGGALYGARLHFGWNAVVGGSDTNPSRRKALVIGADLRLLGGGAGYAKTTATTNGGSAEAGATTFVLSPQLTIGYQAF